MKMKAVASSHPTLWITTTTMMWRSVTPCVRTCSSLTPPTSISTISCASPHTVGPSSSCSCSAKTITRRAKISSVCSQERLSSTTSSISPQRNYAIFSISSVVISRRCPSSSSISYWRLRRYPSMRTNRHLSVPLSSRIFASSKILLLANR
jgi:hypothetical protein